MSVDEDLTPKEKGWQLVKDILDNDEQYLALKQGFYVVLTGSNNLQYVLYPNGNVVKLTGDKPVLGKINIQSKYVDADYLATLIAWIRFDADKFERNWGCGSISLDEETDINQLDRELYDYAVRVREREFRRHSTLTTSGVVIALVVTLVTIGIILPIGLTLTGTMTDTAEIMALDAPENTTNRTTLFSNLTQSMTDLMPVAVALLPIIMLIAVFKWYLD